MRMRWLVAACFGCVLFGSIPSISQTRPSTVSLMQLLASPHKFYGRAVMVQGFLRFYRQPKHGLNVFLYLHEEDAKNLLVSNAVVVIPSKQMLRDEEKLDRTYVHMTAQFAGVRAVGEESPGAGVLEDVQDCRVWSDPHRPIGEPANSHRKESLAKTGFHVLCRICTLSGAKCKGGNEREGDFTLVIRPKYTHIQSRKARRMVIDFNLSEADDTPFCCGSTESNCKSRNTSSALQYHGGDPLPRST